MCHQGYEPSRPAWGIDSEPLTAPDEISDTGLSNTDRHQKVLVLVLVYSKELPRTWYLSFAHNYSFNPNLEWTICSPNAPWMAFSGLWEMVGLQI